MTLKSEGKVCGMHKTSRIELRYPIITVESESKVGAMHRKTRMELGWASITAIC